MANVLTGVQHDQLMAAIHASLAKPEEDKYNSNDDELSAAIAASLADQERIAQDHAWLLARTGVELHGDAADVATMQLLMREGVEYQQQAFQQIQQRQRQLVAEDTALAATLAFLEQEKNEQIARDAEYAKTI
jgi:hypothetical protein